MTQWRRLSFTAKGFALTMRTLYEKAYDDDRSPAPPGRYVLWCVHVCERFRVRKETHS